ncbi:protein RRP6-like 3 isoform X1 [Nicotiana tomentosiformis]|uniref:protein RRP6-like 3 isoform X1 n=1 Tax=Nicotiana tomentosiformis TaxID=4098 RepID=UPI00051C8885|nr:protein RRP6-like 3 isoform X1 [Nicotiana tomentosiformis]
MENKESLKLAVKLAIATCITVAISIFIAKSFQKVRKQNRKKQQKKHSCYLNAESKPQSSFKRVFADNSYSQFKHIKLVNRNEDCTNFHPYKTEITELLKSSNADFLEHFGGNFEDLTMRESYVWVESESQLRELAEVLSKERVFAVDTEQHSLRSFLGFTALIQISTGKEDYLVDTIALHDVMGILRPVFANPGICKVFHGADNDVLWLQRDFHIYVVNLFDTAKACDVLSKPQRSLAYLLDVYCGIVANKLFQREDWRQRPLPAEMVQYARTDAHYLLYIAHHLSSELKEQDTENSSHLKDDKFSSVLEANRRSNAICLQLFSKETDTYPGESVASSIISRYQSDQGSSMSSSDEMKFHDLVRRLCAWRDIMARVHDESLRYVLSEHAIVTLAAKVPISEMGICNAISEADQNPDSPSISSLFQSPSPVVCSHLDDLKYLFLDETGKDDGDYKLILQKCLGSDGSCPLSVYNYALLSKTSLKMPVKSAFKQNGLKNSKQFAKKASRQLFVQKFSCKAPVYHNCRIYANDGRLLCYCDRRKLEWYVNRNLAKLIEEDPPAIMLLFEPKGRPEDEGNDFYIQSKRNICVGCGEGNHYLRYRIIPSCYRMHFPEHLKSHRSHDIVLLCVDCHEIAHAAAEKYKRKIATEFGIPLFVRRVVDSNQNQNTSESSVPKLNAEEEGVSPLQLRTAAMALLRHGSRMPANRREELIMIIRNYYGGREISGKDLERALLIGMSPNERRRFEKKRKLACKDSSRSTTPDDKLDNKQANGTSLPEEISENSSNGEETMNILTVEENNVSNHSSYPNFGVNGEFSVQNNDVPHGRESLVKHDDILPDSDVDESCNVSNGAVNSVDNMNASVSSKRDSKLSLLGHGPHGKQVVNHLLKEHGEEGISQFCQRWRQVFVEAVHPRFLPAGWDVMHSGRRDFGEFSVYNPGKRTPTSTPEQ